MNYDEMTNEQINSEIARRTDIDWGFGLPASSVDSALRLIANQDDWTILTAHDGWHVSKMTLVEDCWDQVEGATHQNLARAICECWLLVQDTEAQDAK